MHCFSTYASMSFVDAVLAAKDALKRQEFSILAEIDMQSPKRASLRRFASLSHCERL